MHATPLESIRLGTRQLERDFDDRSELAKYRSPDALLHSASRLLPYSAMCRMQLVFAGNSVALNAMSSTPHNRSKIQVATRKHVTIKGLVRSANVSSCVTVKNMSNDVYSMEVF